MKILINKAIILLMIIIVSCGQPREQRAKLSSYASDREISSNSNKYSLPFFNNGTSIPENAKHCSWSIDGETDYQNNSEKFGEYNICKNIQTGEVFIQMKDLAKFCVFPTHNWEDQSIYIGDAKCIKDNNRKVNVINFEINRSGYEDYSMTGVMIMPEREYYFGKPYLEYQLPKKAYLICMNSGLPGFCDEFKRAGQYIYKLF